MKYIDEFSEPGAIKKLIKDINNVMLNLNRKICLMEVCGTHTMSIGRSGLRKLLPRNLTLLSGPGCPVCVTPSNYITASIKLAQNPDVIITTFGDMVRVPNSKGRTLGEFPTDKVKVVYSPLDALKLAEDNLSKKIIFLGVGFETTAPVIAETIKIARMRGCDNFYCFSAHKLIPPAIKVLIESPELAIDGFMLPGHVSVAIGKKGYNELAIRGAITGFEPIDILKGIFSLILQIKEEQYKIENCYKRVVVDEGNISMLQVMLEVFEVANTEWRGLGEIPLSGLNIAEKYAQFDAVSKFNIELKEEKEPTGCSCADVLKGLCLPIDCELFGKRCLPQNPVGPCMVSSEGACSAYYKYER